MELKLIRGLLKSMIWMLAGMVVMARTYCHDLAIPETSPLYIGMDTVVITGVVLVMFQLLLWLDPSFQEQE